MKVYRIEDTKTGLGPFITGMAKNHHYEPPGPVEDQVFGSVDDYYDLFENKELFKYKYGFQSKKHLQNWFSEKDLKYFQKKKLSLVEYEIPQWKVYHGGHQCAFNPMDAYSKREIKPKRVLH